MEILSEGFKGICVKHLPRDYVNNIKIPIHEDMENICYKIDKYNSEIDEYTNKIETNKSKIKNLIKLEHN